MFEEIFMILLWLLIITFYVVHLSDSVGWLTIRDYSGFDYDCKNIIIGQFVIVFTC
jgi:hypothetical protein